MVSCTAGLDEILRVDGSLIWRQTYSDAVAYRGRHLLTDSEGNIYVGGDVDAWRIYHSDVGNAMIQSMIRWKCDMDPKRR